MARQLFDTGIFSVIDEASAIGSGWLLGWFVADTTTPTDTYVEPTGGTANSNPVEADADGRFPPMWLDPGDYKYVLYDADGVVIKTQNDYSVADAPPSFDPALDDFLAGDAPLPIANGGTGQATAPNAIAALGGVAKAGDSMTGNLTRATKGGFFFWNASGMAVNEGFLTIDSDPDPTSSAGQSWWKYT